jgi:hypothetical protein
MAGEVTLGAFAGIFPAEGKDISTMATPIGANVSDGAKSVRNTMVYLDFIAIL